MSTIKVKQLSNNTVFGITALFFALSLWGIMNHELWLDEAHHYLLARDSNSFKDLITHTRYEGHPIVWNLILYWVTRVTVNPIWMQVLHISIMTCTVSVFLKKAPFPLLFKLLFIFGYFMFYEYNILSRNYNLGILFVFLACSFYQNRTAKFILIATLLGIASNSHAVFLILASAMMFLLLLERYEVEKLKLSRKTWIGLLIFTTLAIISIIQIIPPTDTSFFERGKDITFLQKISKSLSPFFKSIFLIPDITQHSFWNTNILVNYNKNIAGGFAIVSLVIPYLLFYKNKKIMWYVYIGIIGVGVFFFISALNAARYYGALYLLLITALWFNNYKNPTSNAPIYAFAKEKKSFLQLPENILKKIKRILIYSILGLHFISGMYAYTMDIIHPFTTAKQSAQYLKKNHSIQKTITAPGCSAAALSAYIEKSIYYTSTNSFENYCRFNQPIINLSNEKGRTNTIESIEQLLSKEHIASIIFITYIPYFDTTQGNTWIASQKNIKITLLKQFNGSIIKKGNHYIYEISLHESTI